MAGDTVRIAAGVYAPDEGPNATLGARNSTFNLNYALVILGDYPALGGSDDARNPQMSPTIFTGDLMRNDTVQSAENLLSNPLAIDNAHHVVTIDNATGRAQIHGIIIERGQADSVALSPYGGGILVLGAKVNIVDCIIRFNYAQRGGGVSLENADSADVSRSLLQRNAALIGGGMYRYASDQLVALCDINENYGNGGGGIYGKSAHGKIVSTSIMGNIAKNGAGMYNEQSNPQIFNTVVSSNMATAYGGAIYNHDCSPDIINSTLSGNLAGTDGGAIRNTLNSRPRILNSIL